MMGVKELILARRGFLCSSTVGVGDVKHFCHGNGDERGGWSCGRAWTGKRHYSGAMGVGAVASSSKHGTNRGVGVKRWAGGVLVGTCFIFFCRHLKEAGEVSSIHYLFSSYEILVCC